MPDSSAPKAKDKRDRKATEDALVSAFEAVLLREGVQGLGINAVAQEAGVNKVLIYRYFKDLAGLARHWASNSTFWPSELELIGGDAEAFQRLSVPERVRTVLCNYIDAIRSRPRTVELLAGELLSPNDITRALADGVAGPGMGVSDYIQLESSPTDISDQVWRLIYMVNAVTAYLAVRERANSTYLGFNLEDDEAWDFLRDTVSDISTKYLKD